MTNANATVKSTLLHAMALCPPLLPSPRLQPRSWNCSSFAAAVLQGYWVAVDAGDTVMASRALQVLAPAPALILHSTQRQRRSTTDLTMSCSKPVSSVAWALDSVAFDDDVSCNSMA